ncbi:MAG: hypothetical protein Q4C37_07790 [Bacteroidales bacterium]|nr:hypothetical protein [Bacteroidales bacterium]
MLLADSHITMVVGVDVHVTMAPPFNPIHPYIGMVLDPADYIPFLGTNVSVNGLKRGVSDTGGMIIPMTASFGKGKASLLCKRNGRIEASQTRIT